MAGVTALAVQIVEAEELELAEWQRISQVKQQEHLVHREVKQGLAAAMVVVELLLWVQVLAPA